MHKKIIHNIVLVLSVAMISCLSLKGVVANAKEYDFWIDSIGPEEGSIGEVSNDKLKSDTEKVKEIAMRYYDIYVVTQEDYIDTTPIDDLLEGMSDELTVDDLDNGKIEYNVDDIYSEPWYADYTKRFRTLSGPCNLNVYFEPTVFYKIYRNIYVIGGYYDYSGCKLNVDESLEATVNNIQDLTKEIVQPDTKKLLRKKINDLYWDISQDTGFKVFILVDDKIDAVYLYE